MSNDIYCSDCKVFMRKVSLGHEVKEANSEHTELYTRRGDLYRCPRCGHQVIGDFGEWR